VCIEEHDKEIMAIRKAVKKTIIPKLCALEGFKL
jgi:DNA mismatch repair ATPase MutS